MIHTVNASRLPVMTTLEPGIGGGPSGYRWIAAVPLWVSIPAFWSVFALLNAIQVWLAMMSHGHSFIRILAYHLAVWNLWGLLTPLVGMLARRYPPVTKGNVLIQLVAAIPVVLFHITLWHALEIWIRPYDAMGLSEFGPNSIRALSARLPTGLILYAATVWTFTALAMNNRLREKELRTLQLESDLSKATLHALQLQIQPHFLFNTLHTIGSLVRTSDSRKAVETIAALSDVLRYSLDSERLPLVAFARELEAIERYLDIERIRFGDRLVVSVDVAPEALAIPFPPFLLQPIVENAVRHGMAASKGEAKVILRAGVEGDSVVVEVSNPGTIGSESAGRGLGLENTRRRLEQIYGDSFSLELRTSDEAVITRISIPSKAPEGAAS